MVDLLTCRNKEEPIKMNELEWSPHFPYYNPMGAICFFFIGQLDSEIFMFESVDIRTDARTDAGSSPFI